MPYSKTALAGTFAAGQFVSLWTAPGQPGAGANPAATPGAVPTSATAGAVPFTNPGSGNSYLARLFATSTVPGTLILYDRLVGVGGVTLNSVAAQTVASAALTRPDANGVNAELWIEVTTVPGGTTTITSIYNNQGGVSHTTTPAVTLTTASIAGTTYQLPLVAGDTGIQTCTSTTCGTAVTGTINVVIRRRIAEFAIPAAFLSFPPQDPFWAGLSQIYNSACIEALFLIGSGTAAPAIPSGSLVLAQG